VLTVVTRVCVLGALEALFLTLGDDFDAWGPRFLTLFAGLSANASGIPLIYVLAKSQAVIHRGRPLAPGARSECPSQIARLLTHITQSLSFRQPCPSSRPAAGV
jgi:hypothetical protein